MQNTSIKGKAWPLFYTFFKAGTFTFAGGLAMLPIIQKDVVEKYQLMDADTFLEYATLSQTLPGAIALNCACFVGKKTAGVLGMLVAGIGATISAFVLMLLATMAIQLIPQEGPMMGAMQCIRAASSALILSAAFSLGRYNIKSRFAVIMMLAVFGAVFLLHVNALVMVFIAGVTGYLYQQQYESGKGGSNI